MGGKSHDLGLCLIQVHAHIGNCCNFLKDFLSMPAMYKNSDTPIEGHTGRMPSVETA